MPATRPDACWMCTSARACTSECNPPFPEVRINVAFTQDGSNLLVTDSTAVLHHLDPLTLEVVRSQTVKDRRVNFRPPAALARLAVCVVRAHRTGGSPSTVRSTALDFVGSDAFLLSGMETRFSS